jgi:hypothetical protein
MISPEIIVKRFLKTGISNALDGSGRYRVMTLSGRSRNVDN